ncbi:MAG: nitrite reductase small subunit NirD [Candidatus Omnitrophica bacterium]|nr:nitrite reductase small subunit NirD [Candidatus Omnitrophota bacterium]
MVEAVKGCNWYPVVGVGVIPAKEGRRVRLGDWEAALFNLGGEYRAVDGRCPHKRGPLADGIISGRAVFCPLHNWKISLENGCALSGGKGQVKTYPVKVMGGKVCIAFEEGKLEEVEGEDAGAFAGEALRDVGG